jgi:hypothetical protein
MKITFAISCLGFFAGLLPAAAKPQVFNVHLSVTKVELACINDGGTVTAGKGKGGYGCNYTGGDSVSCNAKGNCTYTIPQTHRAGITNNIRANSSAATRGAIGGSSSANMSKPNALMNRSSVATHSQLYPYQPHR